MHVRPSATIVALAVVLETVAGAQFTVSQPAAPQSETARLAALGRLWTTVRYAHPYLTYRDDIDWDAALVAAMPRVRAATDGREYAAAVSGMLAALNDPATRLRDTAAAASPDAPDAQSSGAEQRDGVLVLRMTNYRELGENPRVMSLLQEQLPAIRSATAIVIDLRQRVPGPGGFLLQQFFRTAGSALTAKRIAGPAVRTVMHSGYAPQTGGSSGGYYWSLQLTLPEAIEPALNVAPKRVAFVVHRRSFIPDVALALQRSGDGIIVSEGDLDDSSIAPTIPVSMGEGITALVRTGELVSGAEARIHADLVVASSLAPGAAFDAAVAFVKGGERPRGAEPLKTTPPIPAWRADRTYAETPYPSAEHRVLGIYRLWGVVNYFFPYKHLMTRDWNASLTEFIPRALAAKDALEYGQAIAEMATWLEDSHVGVDSAALRAFYGEAPTPLTLRYIENVPVVTGFADEAAGKAAGVEVGDVLVKVDGEEVAVRAARLRKYLTFSTPGSANVKVARYLASGPEASEAALTLTGSDGRTKEARLPRRASYMAPRSPSTEPPYRLLPDNIGYVDLTRLESRDVDAMFDALQGTKAIVFDMRGYPRGVFMALGSRLNRKNAQHAAMFLRPVLAAGSNELKFTFMQGILPASKPTYAGKTVMLIDERAISQSEHTGLFLEAASDVTFIGSPTAGANGDVTRLVLPGRVSVGFTGHDVRHADGRQLQKVGLQPHVRVLPTIRGIRDGKDEVLERALRFLKEGT